jgi:predicted SAM-dependent methyltransferase
VRARRSRWGIEAYPISIRPQKPRFVNVGSGSFRHPLWHNLDRKNSFYGWGQNIDIDYDLTSEKPIPLESDSVDVFYCSHVAEHIGDRDFTRFVGEVFRCLRPGGIFRLASPDACLFYEAYLRGDTLFWHGIDPWGLGRSELEHKLVSHLATCLVHKDRFPEFYIEADVIKQLVFSKSMHEFFEHLRLLVPDGCNGIFPEGHVNWYTAEKMIGLLQRGGFSKAARSGFLQSEDAILRDPRWFDNTVPEVSFYVEARKT